MKKISTTLMMLFLALIAIASCSTSKQSILNETTLYENYNDYPNTIKINSESYPHQAVIVANISTESNLSTEINTLTLNSAKQSQTKTTLPYHFHPDLTDLNQSVPIKKMTKKNLKSSKDFYVYDFQNNSNYIVSANLKVSGQHCLIYATNEKNIDSSTWTAIASYFDTTIYPNLNSVLNSTPTDVDSNGKIILLYYDINHQAENNTLLGYFWPYDLFSNSNGNTNYSNEGEILYLNINQSILSMKSKETIAHELTHLVSLSERILNSNIFSQYDIWIEEGIATGATGFLIDMKITDYINYYAINNQDNDIRNGLGLIIDTSSNYSAWNYGLSFSFLEYCRLQYNQDGSFYGQLIKQFNHNDHSDIIAYLKTIQSDTFNTFEDIVIHYHAANLINAPSGKLGYNTYYQVSPLEPNQSSLQIGSGGALYYKQSIHQLSQIADLNTYDENLKFILINHE